MPQNCYNYNFTGRSNSSNIALRFNNQLSHSVPYIDNLQSSQLFYGACSNYTTRYRPTYGMQSRRHRNYRLHYEYAYNRQFCYDVINDSSNINAACNNNINNKLKQCNDIHTYHPFETKGSMPTTKVHYAKKSKSPNNYNRCGNNIVVEARESVNMIPMLNQLEDCANLRPSSSVDEDVMNSEQISLDDIVEVGCQNKNNLNYKEVVHEQMLMISEENTEESNKASSKPFREKTPMCLVNDLARFNKIPFQYRLTSETGPAHCKRFTVTLKLGDEDYAAEANKIKKAQHLAAEQAIQKTKYKHPIPKSIRKTRKHVTPTVELNALAMKLGQQIYYVLENINQTLLSPEHSLTQVPCRGINQRNFKNIDCNNKDISCHLHFNSQPREKLGSYKVILTFGEEKFTAFGRTQKQAKHNAAAQALPIIRDQVNDKLMQEKNKNQTVAHKKSPISLVFEMGSKRKLDVCFKIVREDGPAHMKKFTTACIVGSIKVEAEGTGKRISKNKAAQKMLEELQNLPPITSEDVPSVKHTKSKRLRINNQTSNTNGAISSITSTKVKGHCFNKCINDKPKKRKEMLDENLTTILSKLKDWCEKHNEKEPIFETIVEKYENTRRRQRIVEVTCKGITVRGVGKNKQIAKYNAAKNLLVAIGIESSELDDNQISGNSENFRTETQEKCAVPSMVETCTNSTKLVSSHKSTVAMGIESSQFDDNQLSGNGENFRTEARDEYTEPSITIEPYTNSTKLVSSHKPTDQNQKIDKDLGIVNIDCGINEVINVNELKNHNVKNNATVLTKTNVPIAAQKCVNQVDTECISPKMGNGFYMKDQLKYLANLLGFEVAFSDYPKGNHSEFLSIVMLSTNPPQICHGIGITSAESQENASKNALKILSEMGLNNAKGSSSY